MKPPAWNDLALFAAVARAGTLAGAARETGASIPTLSRRMTALEEEIGRRLFRHGADGYALTEDGRELALRCEDMVRAAAAIETWRAVGPRRVRISCGTWTAQALAGGLRDWWSPDAAWVPELVRAERRLDIARREADIGIRNRRPEEPWLAGRRTRTVTYAAYGTAPGWIAVAVDTPSARWQARMHGAETVTTASDPQIALRLAEAGMGRVVLPTFVGDRLDLPRSGPVIEALTSEEWLVAHQDARHAPGIRDALDALAAHLTRGARPQTEGR
ncbi:LysR family transcriptional regulator [Jannaschia seohaensis]|uniref:DNA-binding transcriptional LysR family regulator n=1 Tax=Jannaschia seohaensis TaxID=475081 RepID=A0A2Y9BAF5_9RHOB|nr:LysR family transcriptional regulator [Jannaschia seohaensis]PWJ12126.1 DNA-binding transcriptional LysR family regulator [Jannaschia seohaensis]SSA51229.1 DNA-binding transcriptional regulator, LysR family [Jannaschia seohaensis]